MNATMKFHVMTFLNCLGGGDSCSLSIFDEKISVYCPELVLLGEPKRLMDELKKTSIFLSSSDKKLELIHCIEASNRIVAEISLPLEDRDLFAALIFDFSDLGISRIKAFYPCERHLQSGWAEDAKSGEVKPPRDLEFLRKFLMESSEGSFLQLFDSAANIRDEQGRYYGGGSARSLSDFFHLYASKPVEILNVVDCGRICAAEIRLGNELGVMSWVRSEDRKILSWRLYANTKILSRRAVETQKARLLQAIQPV